MRLGRLAIAFSFALMLGSCGKAPQPETVPAPPTASNVAPATPVATVGKMPAEVSAAMESRLRAMAGGAKPKTTAPTAKSLAATTDWGEAVDQNLRVKEFKCPKSDGSEAPDDQCPLHVKKVGPGIDDSQPPRYFYIHKWPDGDHYWAVISSTLTPGEFMYCGDLTPGADPSFVSGSCLIQVHPNTGMHWFEAYVTENETGVRNSVYFTVADVGGTEMNVHNGEGHAEEP